MRRLLAAIEFWVVLAVFGIALPIFAFFLAYPNGPEEAYNKIQFEINQQHYNKTLFVTLKDGFIPAEQAAFNRAADVLTKADTNTRVVITIEDNLGGYTRMLWALEKQIKESKAYVVLRVQHYAMSAGAWALGYGNVAFIAYDSVIMFHLGSTPVVNPDRSVFYGKIRRNSDNLYIDVAYGPALERMAFYVPWLTRGEFIQTLDGKDVTFSGRDLCFPKDGRATPVLFHLKDGCVIEGFKK